MRQKVGPCHLKIEPNHNSGYARPLFQNPKPKGSVKGLNFGFSCVNR
ncbi:hypothetical protein CCACVL1_00195 [Corchorus capsularis]|uniref:Uncharacterized protein n=1 Tax=Corchorus capsularis TaxID=210143 RepID=A0A1R3KXZ8_COCAP|nr:hypothetical protein CCACVL1_00195 [Corchorus capsularis]